MSETMIERVERASNEFWEEHESAAWIGARTMQTEAMRWHAFSARVEVVSSPKHASPSSWWSWQCELVVRVTGGATTRLAASGTAESKGDGIMNARGALISFARLVEMDPTLMDLDNDTESLVGAGA